MSEGHDASLRGEIGDPELEPAAAAHHARPSLLHALAVLCGGALGTLARDLLLRAEPAARTSIPWMLVALNLVGAALLGLVVARVLDPRPSAVSLRLFVATGLLGGFTTYSSLVSAAVVSQHDGHAGVAVLTLLGTAIVGVGAAWLGGYRQRQTAP
jgi:fluoride exporter